MFAPRTLEQIDELELPLLTKPIAAAELRVRVRSVIAQARTPIRLSA